MQVAQRVNLIKRGNIALEDSNWSKAEQLFNQALDIDIQSAEAYVGLAMVKAKATTWLELQNYVSLNAHIEIKGIERAREYAREELTAKLQEIDGLKKEWESIAALKREKFKTASCLFAPSGVNSYNLILYSNGRCNRNWDNLGWTDIIAIASGEDSSCCLKSDGSVLSGGNNVGWRNIIEISMMPCPDIYSGPHEHLVGLKADGTVVATNYIKDADGYSHDEGQFNVSSWKDIVAVFTCGFHTVGIKSDGTIVAVGRNNCGQCNLSGYKLFDNLDELVKKHQTVYGFLIQQEYELRKKEKQLKVVHQEQLKNKQAILQKELVTLKGIFTGRRRRDIQARLMQIEMELESLQIF